MVGRNRNIKERRAVLESLIREHRAEFERLDLSRNKNDIKLFINNRIKTVLQYGSTIYYFDIYFALKRLHKKLFNTESTMENNLSKALNQPPPTKDEIIAALPVYAAVDRLKMALTEDRDLHTTWKENIAAAFYNEAEKYCRENNLHWGEHDREVTMIIAQKSAINFINHLCSTSTNESLKKD